jgi:hypothetical protein
LTVTAKNSEINSLSILVTTTDGSAPLDLRIRLQKGASGAGLAKSAIRAKKSLGDFEGFEPTGATNATGLVIYPFPAK